jgi:hypothetical protein
MLFHSTNGCIPVTPCISSANSNYAVDCYVYFDIVIQYLLPCSANFETRISCNLGCVGQLNDPCPSSPGATRSNDLFDCCVGGV